MLKQLRAKLGVSRVTVPFPAPVEVVLHPVHAHERQSAEAACSAALALLALPPADDAPPSREPPASLLQRLRAALLEPPAGRKRGVDAARLDEARSVEALVFSEHAAVVLPALAKLTGAVVAVVDGAQVSAALPPPKSSSSCVHVLFHRSRRDWRVERLELPSGESLVLELASRLDADDDVAEMRVASLRACARLLHLPLDPDATSKADLAVHVAHALRAVKL